MGEVIERRDGLTLTLHQDTDAEMPRGDYQSTLGIIADWHRTANIGDLDRTYRTMGGETRHHKGCDRKVSETELDALRRGGWPLLKRYLRMTEGASHILPISLLDHSGWHVWVGGGSHWSDAQGWDSGTVGFIYTTPEKIAETGAPEDSIDRQLKGEIEELDQYFRGDVYGYTVTRDSNHEELDACLGFFGYDYAVTEAKSAFEREHREHLLNLAQFDGSILFGEVAS